MKMCPQCGAEYDAHVEFCFVDGTALTQPPASGNFPIQPPPSLRAEPSRTVPLLLVALLSLVAIPLAVIASLFFTWLGSDDPSETKAELPPPIPAAKPPPPVEPDPVQVSIKSTPSGAEVWEGETRLCDETPCLIEQYEHAPRRRRLILRMPGHLATPVDLTKSVPELRVPMLVATPSETSPAPVNAVTEEPEGTVNGSAGGLIDRR